MRRTLVLLALLPLVPLSAGEETCHVQGVCHGSEGSEAGAGTCSQAAGGYTRTHREYVRVDDGSGAYVFMLHYDCTRYDLSPTSHGYGGNVRVSVAYEGDAPGEWWVLGLHHGWGEASWSSGSAADCRTYVLAYGQPPVAMEERQDLPCQPGVGVPGPVMDQLP